MRQVPPPSTRPGLGAPGVQVTPCPAGPILVRGVDEVRAQDGTLHQVTRPVVALCACGKSQRSPWCDGTHKVIPDKEQPR